MSSSGFRKAIHVCVVALGLVCPAAQAIAEEGVPPRGSGSGTAERSASRNAPLDTLFWAPEIVVVGRRAADDDPVGSPAFVAVVDAAARRGRADDIASLLSRTVGVRVKRYGGLGAFAGVSIRGSSSSQVAVYLDGVPLNNAWTGMTDLSSFAPGDLERIEVYRGASPARFGASAVGGTINLVPRGFDGLADAGRPVRVGADLSTGSFGERGARVGLTARLPSLLLDAAVSLRESDGDFPFLDDNGTPFSALDDETTDRRNNDCTRWNGTARIAVDAPGFRTLALSHLSSNRESGVAGIGANQSTAARAERARRITWLRGRAAPAFGGLVNADLSAWYSWTADRFSDPEGEIGLGARERDNRLTMYGGNLGVEISPRPVPLSLEIRFETRRERFHPVDLIPVLSAGPDRLRDTRILTAAGAWRALGGRVELTASTRHEWHETEYYAEHLLPWVPPTPEGLVRRHHESPAAGCRVRILPGLSVKGNWSRAARVPTFYELFGDLGAVTGNADIRPETATNRDIGLVFTRERLWLVDRPFLEVAWLDNEIDDLILFFPNSQRTVQPANIGAARVRGVELSLSCRRGPLRLAGNWTRLDARDRSDIPYYAGNRLPATPEHEAALDVGWHARRWRVSWELHYIGANFLDRANMQEVASREIHDIAVELRSPGGAVTFTIEGRNLGDDRVSDVIGFPLPGRSVYASLRIEH